jgi:hypothetical protein
VPYVYAVTEAGAAEPDPPLHLVRLGELAAVVADHEAPAPTVDALRRHDERVRALAGDAPLLPMRFGSTTGDVAGFLAARADGLRAALERVRGAVELGAALPDEPWPDSGTEYLARRARAARIHAALAARARAGVALPHPRVGTYLVDAGAAGAFRERAAALGAVCSGPWPPYSFAAA